MNAVLPGMLILLCMAGEAFFSGMETGVISIHRLKLRHFVRLGSRRARVLQQFLDNPDRLLGTTLTGTNLCVVMTSVGTASLALATWGPWGQAASTAFTTAVLLVFCEYLPKAWFHSKPYERCSLLAPLLALAERILKPLSATIIGLSRWLVRGRSQSFSRADLALTREELKILTHQGETDGVFSASERAMIHRVFELSGKRASDIMVPKAKMTFVYTDTSLPEFYELARAVRYTRMPVYDRAQHAFVGIVNVFAVASSGPARPGRTVAGFVRPPLSIPEATPVDDILPRLRRSRQPLCLVVNDQREVTGLLTIEDILKEIVGQL